jgi:hypothetical protein
MGRNGAEEEERETRVRPGVFILHESTPRHTIEQGGGASAEEKRSTPSCCPPCEEEDEDDLLAWIFP